MLSNSAVISYTVVLFTIGLYAIGATAFYVWMARARHPMATEEATHPVRPELRVVEGGLRDSEQRRVA